MNFLSFPYICIKQQSRPALVNSQDERALPVVDSRICPYHFVSLQEIRASFWRQSVKIIVFINNGRKSLYLQEFL
jgi:hypothetical protein